MPAELKSRFYRFNASPIDASRAHDIFQRITGVTITYYPMVLGISAEGRLVVFNGTMNASTLEPFLLGLEQT
jgi:succinate dehydrogenase/fumarate reductase cytochrome b subunit